PVAGTLSFSSVTTSSITITCSQATDGNAGHTAATLEYKIVKAATSAAIDTIEEIEAITTAEAGRVQDWSANDRSESATSLSENTTYYFAAAVRDASGNKAVYAPQSQATLKAYYVFVTNSGWPGNMGGDGGGVTKADSNCNDINDPNRPPGASLTYKALIVDGTNRVACTSANCTTGGASENVNWVLKASTYYKNWVSSSSTVIGQTTSAGLFSFSISAKINTGFNPCWTGLNADFTIKNDGSSRCTSWTDNSAGPEGGSGQTNAQTSSLIDSGGTTPCNSSSKLICVEQ
ncbi:MAG: DUF1554 domain-containing protein, partial [Oligoflexales bacterium]|nr:DUF1554 domain-containing protein [Oligoflexales bacterium]